MNKAALVIVRNPFHPALGREQRDIAVGTRLADVVPVGTAPFIVMLNGQAVLRKDWQQGVDRDDVVAIVVLPRGDGGGGDSNPLKIVLMIAVAVFAPQLSLAMWAEAGVISLGMGLTVGSLTTMAIGFVGNALINAIAGGGGGTTRDTSANQMASMAAPSPTYSLQAQGNVARLESAIPVQYGRMCAYPDFAALPYVEYEGNEQYLYQLFCLGAGEYDIEAIRIEDTPIGNFEEISTTIVPPGQPLTAFPALVETSVEVGGLDINTQGATVGPFVANSAGTSAYKIGLDFVMPRGIYQVNTGNGSLMDWSVGWRMYVRAIDDNGDPLPGLAGNWVEQTPGYHLAASNTPQRVTLSFDAVGDRNEVKVVRDSAKSGASTFADDLMWVGLRAYLRSPRTFGDVTLLAMKMRATGTLSGQASRKINVICTRKLPALHSDNYNVVAAVPTVSGNCIATLTTISKAGGAAAWDSQAYSARSFHGGASVTFKAAQVNAALMIGLNADPTLNASYTGIDYALYCRADGLLEVWESNVPRVLDGAPTYAVTDTLSVVYDGTNVRYYKNATVLRTVAAAANLDLFLDSSFHTPGCSITDLAFNPVAVATRNIATAAFDMLTSATWGAGLRNARADLAGLTALATTWAARGDEFNGRFDNSITFWEALTKVARAGRAYPYMQGGIVRFSRDEQQAVPVGLFSMRNIVKGSFSVQYLTPHEAMSDAIDVTYFDSTYWSQRRVRAALPDSAEVNPVKITMFGITDRTAAYREGLYEAACNKYRRKLIRFATSMEGFIPSFGDLVAIAHDMPAWGQTAEVTAWDAGTKTLTLTESLTWGVGTHYIGLRKRDGKVDGPIAVTAGAAANQLVLATDPSFTPYVGQAEERTHIAFGWAETWRQPARVIEVKPRGVHEVEIVCVNEDNAVHTADVGGTPPALQTSQLTTRWTAPDVTGFIAQGHADSPDIMFLSWQPSPGAEKYYVEQSGDDGSTWQRVGEPTTNNFTCPVMFKDNTWVRVAAIGMARGGWQTIDYGTTYLATLALPPSAPTSFAAAIQSDRVWLSWAANAATDLAGYIIKYGGADWATAVDVDTLTATRTSLTPNWTGNRTFRIKAYDLSGNVSDEATVVATVSAPAAPGTVAPVIDAENIVLEWSAPTPTAASLSVAEYELRYGASWSDVAVVSLGRFTATAYRQKIDWVGTRTFWVAAYDVAGNLGAVASMPVTIVAPAILAALSAEVIDNNVLLSWSAPAAVAGNLPIVTYELRRGPTSSTWETATPIGTKSGLFTSVFETVAGTYSYWVAAVDSKGNVGTARSVAVAVNQPPDYVLKETYASTFSGADTTFSNGIKDGDRALLLVNVAETFADHFINNSWTTPQQQVDAGHPIYLQPGLTSAYYEEIFDYGSVLAANKVTVAATTSLITGAATVATTISVSEDKVTWTTPSAVSSLYATNFRYVKVRITATASGGNDLLELSSLTVRLDSKLKTVTGTKTCLAADSGGTIVYLTEDKTSGGVKSFIDVDAITLSVSGTTPLIAVYDFTDSPDPLSFKILLFTTGGARSDGTVSYTVRGF